ncbi:unnamed protein product [Aphanomyces euteiches]
MINYKAMKTIKVHLADNDVIEAIGCGDIVMELATPEGPKRGYGKRYSCLDAQIVGVELQIEAQPYDYRGLVGSLQYLLRDDQVLQMLYEN